MSIDGVREGLESAKQRISDGWLNAEAGRNDADDAVTKFAEAESRRLALLEQAKALRLLMKNAGVALKDLTEGVYEVARLQEQLGKISTGVHRRFSLAENHAATVQAILTEVLGEEADQKCDPCVDLSQQAAKHAIAAAARAGDAGQQFYQTAHKLRALTQDFDQIDNEVMSSVTNLSTAGMSQPETAATTVAGSVSSSEPRGGIAHDMASAYEKGNAAGLAFDNVERFIHDRINRL